MPFDDTSKRATAQLRELRTAISMPNAWCKRAMWNTTEDGQEQHCLLGWTTALGAADVVPALASQIINAPAPGDAGVCAPIVVAFNDRHSTTIDNVIRVIDRAIKASESTEETP